MLIKEELLFLRNLKSDEIFTILMNRPCEGEKSSFISLKDISTSQNCSTFALENFADSALFMDTRKKSIF